MTTSLEIARAEIGTVEAPPNSNHTKYGVWYGMDRVAWCAIFLSWVMHHAGMGDLYRFASTASSIAWAKRKGLWRTGVVPQPGWIAVKLYTSTTGHTGIVEYTEGGYDVTIEGNTSFGDDRNGGIVQRRKRSRSFWNGYIELPLQHPSGQPVPVPPTAEPPAPGSTEIDRIMGLQRAVGTTVDGNFGPKTQARCSANFIGWVDEVRRRGSRADMAGNRNPLLVSWFKLQLNRRWGAGLDPANMAIGPAVNHHIVVNLGQSDGIAGPNAFREACR